MSFIRGFISGFRRSFYTSIGTRYAAAVVEMCERGEWEDAAEFEASMLNPIQRKLGRPESRYALEHRP